MRIPDWKDERKFLAKALMREKGTRFPSLEAAGEFIETCFSWNDATAAMVTYLETRSNAEGASKAVVHALAYGAGVNQLRALSSFWRIPLSSTELDAVREAAEILSDPAHFRISREAYNTTKSAPHTHNTEESPLGNIKATINAPANPVSTVSSRMLGGSTPRNGITPGLYQSVEHPQYHALVVDATGIQGYRGVWVTDLHQVALFVYPSGCVVRFDHSRWKPEDKWRLVSDQVQLTIDGSKGVRP